MRHRNKVNGLSRKKGHRDLMLGNMACSLIEHKRINTTVTKAKILKRYVEPLITRAKEDTTPSRRAVFRHLQQKQAVTELFREVGPKVATRPGGYCRILKTGFRPGDGAEMCFIELVDYNDNMLKDPSAKKKTARRSRRGGAKSAASTAATAVAGVADKVADKAHDVAEGAKDAITDAGDAAKDAVSKAKDVAADAKDAAKGAVEKAKDVANKAKDAAKDAADDAKDVIKGDDK